MKMSRDTKVFLLSFLGAAFVVVVANMAINSTASTPGDSVRLQSLGTPKIVPLDPAKGEQKVILNDPSIQKNWGLMGTNGQSDIMVNRAWDITQGDRQIIVAVIDTGADISHPDLAENIWHNPGESGLDAQGRDKATNGIDDDGNGFIDDVNGWDFVNNKPTVIDNHGHGTHIAGIIGAVGGNGVGISGVCPKVSLMILKYFDPTSKGNDNLRNTVRAIRYAANMGANIINYSGGGTEPNDDEFQAVKYAADKGVLFVAAAGNEHSNSDSEHYYPADYNLSNIISVTAIDPSAHVLKTSNYGLNSVHIAAPGEGIYSTLPGGNYGFMTGTSQATAFVTGVATLVMAHNKDFSDLQVKKQILATADEIPGLRGKTSTGGKLNSYAALAIQPAIPATGIASARSSPSMTAGVIGANREKSSSVLFNSETESSSQKDNPISDILKALGKPLAGSPPTSSEKRSAAQAL